MTIGGALFLIAVGAILRFAVTDHIAGIDLQIVGLILMIIGVVGLLLGLFMMFGRRRRTPPVTYDQPPETRTYDRRPPRGY